MTGCGALHSKVVFCPDLDSCALMCYYIPCSMYQSVFFNWTSTSVCLPGFLFVQGKTQMVLKKKDRNPQKPDKSFSLLRYLCFTWVLIFFLHSPNYIEGTTTDKTPYPTYNHVNLNLNNCQSNDKCHHYWCFMVHNLKWKFLLSQIYSKFTV